LRGACVVQGMVTAVLLRKALPGVAITESHPKALLWLLRIADRDRHPAGVSLLSLPQFSVPPSAGITDPERDAAIGTLCAWGMFYGPDGWRDLRLEEQDPYSPITPPLGYWMPQIAQANPGG
jgi:hypothetical protein